ncbi:unnamed protein product [Auanema sp. JU1783]|nr:unnamed protein product [Auanema sp. JU1783]
MGVGVNDTVCLVDPDLPAYHPNIYICKNNTLCCSLNGKIKCCANDLTLKELFAQALPIVLVFSAFLLIALITKCIFSESEPYSEDEEEDHAYENHSELTYDMMVPDPLFGMQYEANINKFKQSTNALSDEVRERKSRSQINK